MKERTSVSTGLTGCIRLLDVNNMVYNLQENGGNVVYGKAVGECGNNPCVPNPCKHGALCQAKGAEMFHCKCVNPFSGEFSIATLAICLCYPVFHQCIALTQPDFSTMANQRACLQLHLDCDLECEPRRAAPHV